MTLIDETPLLQLEAEHLSVLQDANDNILLVHGEGGKKITLQFIADARGLQIICKTGRLKATGLTGRAIILVRPPRQKRRKPKRK